MLTKAIYDEMQEFHPNTLLYTIPGGQLAQLVKALGLLLKGHGFEPDLAPTYMTCLLSPPLAI